MKLAVIFVENKSSVAKEFVTQVVDKNSYEFIAGIIDPFDSIRSGVFFDYSEVAALSNRSQKSFDKIVDDKKRQLNALTGKNVLKHLHASIALLANYVGSKRNDKTLEPVILITLPKTGKKVEEIEKVLHELNGYSPLFIDIFETELTSFIDLDIIVNFSTEEIESAEYTKILTGLLSKNVNLISNLRKNILFGKSNPSLLKESLADLLKDKEKQKQERNEARYRKEVIAKKESVKKELIASKQERANLITRPPAVIDYSITGALTVTSVSLFSYGILSALPIIFSPFLITGALAVSCIAIFAKSFQRKTAKVQKKNEIAESFIIEIDNNINELEERFALLEQINLDETPKVVNSEQEPKKDEKVNTKNPVKGNELYESLCARHDGIIKKFHDYELDLFLSLAYPAMVDKTVPETQSFHKSLLHANTVREQTNIQAEIGDVYYEAILDLELTFQQAETYAMKKGQFIWDAPERKKVKQAQDLLKIATNESSSTNEKRLSFQQALKLVEGIAYVPQEGIITIQKNIGLIEA